MDYYVFLFYFLRLGSHLTEETFVKICHFTKAIVFAFSNFFEDLCSKIY